MCLVSNSDFAMSLCIRKELFSLTLSLSETLQKVDCDLSEASSNVQDIIDILQQWRSNNEDEFSSVFKAVTRLLEFFNSEVSVRQTESLSVFPSNVQFQIWKTKFNKLPATDRPKLASSSLSVCHKGFFFTSHFLLKVLATLPVNVATDERTISTLKRLKTYFRNAAGHER